jgi:hypothetical protein
MPRRTRRTDVVDHRALRAQAAYLDRFARTGRLLAPRVPLGALGTAGPLSAAAAAATASAGATPAGSHVTAEPSGLLVARFRPAGVEL